MRKLNTARVGIAAAALAAALFLALPASAGAQDDPFDAAAFDTATGAAPAPSAPGDAAPGAAALPSGAARTEYLVGGTVLAVATGTLHSGLDGYAALASASGRLFGKVAVPDYGSLYMSYNITQAMFEGLAGKGDPALVPPLDLSTPSYALAELYYSFDVGKKLFVRAGKQLLAWGPSRVWSPVDFVNLQRQDFFSSLDLRVGKPGLKLLLPMGKANATIFADFSGLVSNGAVSDPVLATNLAGRLDATLGGFELGLTGYGGSGTQAKTGLDFSGDFLGSSVYGELAYAPAYSGYSGSLMASMGIARALGDLKRWTLSMEGFYNSRGADLTGQGPALLASTPLYVGMYYAYAGLKADELLSQYLATTLSGIANFSDLSWTLRFQEDFAFPRALPFSLILAYAGGGAGKEFTYLGGDGAVSVTLQTRIEF